MTVIYRLLMTQWSSLKYRDTITTGDNTKIGNIYKNAKLLDLLLYIKHSLKY